MCGTYCARSMRACSEDLAAGSNRPPHSTPMRGWMDPAAVSTAITPCEPAPVPDLGPRYSLWQLMMYFLRLGTIGFGGPVALIEYMRRDLVEERTWISEADYMEGLALSQLAPGPLAAQLAIYLGFVHYRVLGATLAGLAFVLPSLCHGGRARVGVHALRRPLLGAGRLLCGGRRGDRDHRLQRLQADQEVDRAITAPVGHLPGRGGGHRDHRVGGSAALSGCRNPGLVGPGSAPMVAAREGAHLHLGCAARSPCVRTGRASSRRRISGRLHP